MRNLKTSYGDYCQQFEYLFDIQIPVNSSSPEPTFQGLLKLSVQHHQPQSNVAHSFLAALWPLLPCLQCQGSF